MLIDIVPTARLHYANGRLSTASLAPIRASVSVRPPLVCVQIDAFTADFSDAMDRAVALDQKIMDAAAQVSENYVNLVSLGARQTMASLDITVLGNSDGSVDASDVKIFMKDVGTSGCVRAPGLWSDAD